MTIKVRMKHSQWRQPVWWHWEILRVSTFILGFIRARWMRLKGNAGLQFLHQQNGDNISTSASHFKWKALHSCKIASSCQYTAEFFTFRLEHCTKIPPHMEENKYCRLQKMWFFGSWQHHLHSCIFAFQIQAGLAMKFTIIWWLLWSEPTVLPQVSQVPSQLSPAPALALAQAGADPQSHCLGSGTWGPGAEQSPEAHTQVWSRDISFGTSNSPQQDGAAASIVIPPFVHRIAAQGTGGITVPGTVHKPWWGR